MPEGFHFSTAVELARQMYATLMQCDKRPAEIVVNKPQETVDD